ncbi:MAG: NADH-quinone oxidoreductase subunit J family protein [Pirellulales bacterium]
MEAINWHSFFFLFFALIACAFALAVAFCSHIVRMAFYLVLSLGATAGLFFLAGADFIGAMQLMIYVGGTVVLLAFGVMLTAQGPFVSMKTSLAEWITAALVGASLLVVLLNAALSPEAWRGTNLGGARAAEEAGPNSPHVTASAEPVARATATRIGMGLLGARVDQFDQPDPAVRAGMSGYLLPFELVSVHLVVVLIGAAYLARTKRRVRPARKPAQATP